MIFFNKKITIALSLIVATFTLTIETTHANPRRKLFPESERINLRERLGKAIEDEDLQEIHAAITDGAGLNDCSQNGFTPLTQAFHEQAIIRDNKTLADFEIANFLLRKGARADILDNFDACPLVDFACFCDAETGAALIKNSTDLNVTGCGSAAGYEEIYCTALHSAASYANATMLELLIENGADIHTTELGELESTPLHCAAYNTTQNTFHLENTRTKCVSKLIKEGAQIDARDSEQNTPLHLAAASGFNMAIQLLVAAGSDVFAVNSSLETPLNLAQKSLAFIDAKKAKKRAMYKSCIHVIEEAMAAYTR